MKTTIAIILLFLSQICFAQMDDKFYQPSTELKIIEGLNYTDFKIPVDTETITGIFIKPKTTAKATILFFHGSGGNVSSYMFMTKPLVEAGYQVLMVDFRGYGKSTGIPTHQNIAKDGQKFLDYSLNLEEVKNKPVILYGASMGSEVATHLAKNNSMKITALVLDGCISSFNDVAIIFAPQYESYINAIAFPYAAKEDIKTVTIPKLFIHSDGDKTIPISQGKVVFDNAQNPKTFLKYDGDHLEAFTKDKDAVLKAIAELIKK
ncbi:alpha/beta hydrolase [Frigoriflavimonas asaccharolytica]|uniref:Serine aminopeptidase S33 domain-containing protein n=1 Tax=Frigoriflavimonas asaccharolytica TaxID=2735899 RepID=A0A8J8G8Q1_9FLAO|nr:alpha/beta fold hydrolase [Frigoriflavimonas asaccharolytica]NRS93384.1 hypothetical protein [Frigoriflavimonas asaccharolytica]